MKILITCLTVSMLSGAAFADTWTVDDDGKADFDNIQAAIDAASDGDEIVVISGTYTSTQDGHVVNMLGKSVTLRSSDPDDPEVVAATIIDGENTRRGIACYNEETTKTIISGFTITNGYGAYFDYDSDGYIDPWEFYGGGMYNYENSNLALTNCTFTYNTATFGGGMFNHASSLTLTNCTFKNNTADKYGGGMHNSVSYATLTDTTLCGNTPDQIDGTWTDGGGNTVTYDCPNSGACCTNDNCLVSEQEDCLAFFGEWQGEGTTCDDNSCPTSCPGDINGDNQVNVNDLMILIAYWGACP